MFSGRMLPFGHSVPRGPAESGEFLIPTPRSAPLEGELHGRAAGGVVLDAASGDQSDVVAADRAARAARVRKRWQATAIVFGGAGVLVAVLVDPLLAGAALVTGVLNTAGGGGAVVTFLALYAAGVPALTAHATSQLVTPASFLSGLRRAQTHRPDRRWVAAGGVGVVCGVAILTVTPPATFQTVAPWCLVTAAALVVAQSRVQQRVVCRTGWSIWSIGPTATICGVFVCGVYAGLIGVGAGTLAVAVLGLVPGLVHTRLSDLMQVRNLLLTVMAVVVAAAVAVTGLADWRLVALLVVPAAVGGWLGTKIIGAVPAWLLRTIVVVTALGAAAWMTTRP